MRRSTSQPIYIDPFKALTLPTEAYLLSWSSILSNAITIASGHWYNETEVGKLSRNCIQNFLASHKIEETFIADASQGNHSLTVLSVVKGLPIFLFKLGNHSCVGLHWKVPMDTERPAPDSESHVDESDNVEMEWRNGSDRNESWSHQPFRFSY